MQTVTAPSQIAADAIAHRLADAVEHMAAAARTEAHWAWQENNGEVALFRVYPLQGARVRQDDVTLFRAAH